MGCESAAFMHHEASNHKCICTDLFCLATIGILPPLLPVVVLPVLCHAQSMAELATPHSGRSMRATSTQLDEDGNYAHGNSDNSRVRTRGNQSRAGRHRAGSRHTHVVHVSRARTPTPGPRTDRPTIRRCCCASSMTAIATGDRSPVGDFFANCFGKRSEVISVPVVVEDGDSYNCFWHMPFRKSIRIEVVNQSEKNLNLLYYNIDWIKKDSLPDDTPYFYAQYRQEYPVQPGQDYVDPGNEGKGHYVGTVWPCGRAAPPGSAKAMRRSTSTAKRSRRSGAPAPRLLPVRLGTEDDQHTVFRHALFRPVGNRRRPHLAYRWHVAGPDRLQQVD